MKSPKYNCKEGPTSLVKVLWAMTNIKIKAENNWL